MYDKDKHIENIKSKLSKALSDDNISVNKLTKNLNDLGYPFTYNTINDTLNSSTQTLNTLVVVALCKYWDLDLNYVLAEPDENSLINKVYSFEEDNDKFVVLTDKMYAGSYTCYFLNYYSSKFPNESNLLKGTMEITIDDKGASAVFTSGFDDKANGKNIFRGVPYLSTFTNNIVLFMHDEIGKFYFFTMHYKKYHSKEMMFRIGTMQTVYKQSNCMPLSQKFIMFRNDIQPESQKYLLGILDMDFEKIIIRNNDLKQLAKKEPIVMQFCEQFEKLLANSTHEAHIFTKQQIFDEFDIYMDTEDILRALLLIKNFSVSPKLVKLTDDYTVYNLSKKF